MELVILVGIGAAGAVYLLPSIVAHSRQHPQARAIALVNVLLGWTFIGWAVAIVWAVSAFNPPERKAA